MSALFKPSRPFPLPPDAEPVTRQGKPFARVGGTLYPLSKCGTKFLKPAAKWVADVVQADGTRKRVRFSPNKGASQMMLSDLLKRIENERCGVVDRFADHRKRTLAEHLTDWRQSLEANGAGGETLIRKVNRVSTACGECRFLLTTDLNPDAADRLERFLHARRTRHGASVQTANDWLQAVRQFARWLAANSRIERDPFARLKPGNAKVDVRRRRGEFTSDEVTKLLATVAASPDAFRGLAGIERRAVEHLSLIHI